MGSPDTTFPTPVQPNPRVASKPRRVFSEKLVYLAIAALVLGAWGVVDMTGLKAGSDTGYWLGVAGGVMMLLLFAYPLRKRVRVMQHWGAAKWWFAVHMLLGIGGPVLILVHSTFHIGSLNAGVALYSMLIVAASGVVGRFLYLRTHRGLSGELEGLAQLHRRLGLHHDSLHRMFEDAPAVERELLAFEADALRVPGRWGRHARAFAVLPWRQLAARRRCMAALQLAVQRRARARNWNAARRRAEYLSMREHVLDYLQLALRAAQFDSATRLFSLWHVLHVPFVYVMVLCALVHVVAVHAY
ncbi:hypothetical protein [Caenimonas sp. SL110]|uniref:hypothetical protein n=1 Tax=Caenimonas sp. SL110 TaxID=1450524 RepID=UPI00069F14CB|nr:hypothetical protein [Caenimonas sp. SL110]